MRSNMEVLQIRVTRALGQITCNAYTLLIRQKLYIRAASGLVMTSAVGLHAQNCETVDFGFTSATWKT